MKIKVDWIMRVKNKIPPREFSVGLHNIKIHHVADISLASDEMITFVGHGNSQYDVVKKNWGYYATPSLGGRLKTFGLRAAIIRNIDTRQCFVILAHEDKLDLLEEYMSEERQEIILWLDDYEKLANIAAL